jgi:hypothetical protein
MRVNNPATPSPFAQGTGCPEVSRVPSDSLLRRYGALTLQPHVLRCIAANRVFCDDGALCLCAHAKGALSRPSTPEDDLTASWETLNETPEDTEEGTEVDEMWWLHPEQTDIEEIFEYLEARQGETRDEIAHLETIVFADVIGSKILDMIDWGQLPGLGAGFLADMERRYPHAAGCGRQLARLARQTECAPGSRPAWAEIFFQETSSLEQGLLSAYGAQTLQPVSLQLIHLIRAEYKDGEIRHSADSGVGRLISLAKAFYANPDDPTAHGSQREFLQSVEAFDQCLQAIPDLTPSAIDKVFQRLEFLRGSPGTAVPAGVYAAYYDVVGGEIWNVLHGMLAEHLPGIDAAFLSQLEMRYPNACIGGRALAKKAAPGLDPSSSTQYKDLHEMHRQTVLLVPHAAHSQGQP